VTYTRTRTFVNHSYWLWKFLAEKRAKRLNRQHVAQHGLPRYRGDRYDVVHHNRFSFKRWVIIDWGET
jgi:hypothetical protein